MQLQALNIFRKLEFGGGYPRPMIELIDSSFLMDNKKAKSTNPQLIINLPPDMNMADLLNYRISKNEIQKRQLQNEMNKLGIQKQQIEMNRKFISNKLKQRKAQKEQEKNAPDPEEQQLKEELQKKMEQSKQSQQGNKLINLLRKSQDKKAEEPAAKEVQKQKQDEQKLEKIISKIDYPPIEIKTVLGKRIDLNKEQQENKQQPTKRVNFDIYSNTNVFSNQKIKERSDNYKNILPELSQKTTNSIDEKKPFINNNASWIKIKAHKYPQDQKKKVDFAYKSDSSSEGEKTKLRLTGNKQ
ncbi:UNKNOWN [Stylonychia lemnae]|uniref:Uncharacterized protein n=1 Tax=Stylonychia lemnae TaxID=5949 RepID=A0A077ZYH2_STYLE|nr:UNKNOWN [Stylonychia lemnae]|eukprot:CDW74991.1 UNKNOWN [Stylonychia lemnae]